MKETAHDAYYALTHIEDIYMALDIAEKHLINYINQYKENGEEAITLHELSHVGRMSTCWMVINLCRLKEFWSRYNRFASKELRKQVGSVLSEIDSRGIVRFRNTIAAHLFDNATQLPPNEEETWHQVQFIWNDDINSFLRWIGGSEDDNDDLHDSDLSVCGTLKRLFIHIRDNHEIIHPEFVKNSQKIQSCIPTWLRGRY